MKWTINNFLGHHIQMWINDCKSRWAAFFALLKQCQQSSNWSPCTLNTIEHLMLHQTAKLIYTINKFYFLNNQQVFFKIGNSRPISSYLYLRTFKFVAIIAIFLFKKQFLFKRRIHLKSKLMTIIFKSVLHR